MGKPTDVLDATLR